MSKKIKIDKNVEVSEPLRAGRYPWEEMDTGDSFEVETDKAGGARSSLNALKKRKPEMADKVFISRTQENGHIRFWRTE